MFARMERFEIGYAIDAEDDGLAIDDELLVAVFQGGLDDPVDSAWSSRSRPA